VSESVYDLHTKNNDLFQVKGGARVKEPGAHRNPPHAVCSARIGWPIARLYRTSGQKSTPLGQTMVPASASNRTCLKNSTSLSGTKTPPRPAIRSLRSTSFAKPSVKHNSSRYSPTHRTRFTRGLMISTLLKRLDSQCRPFLVQPTPVLHQSALAQRGPFENHRHRPAWRHTLEEGNRFDSNLRLPLSIGGVKVRRIVVIELHPNHDAKKPADLRPLSSD